MQTTSHASKRRCSSFEASTRTLLPLFFLQCSNAVVNFKLIEVVDFKPKIWCLLIISFFLLFFLNRASIIKDLIRGTSRTFAAFPGCNARIQFLLNFFAIAAAVLYSMPVISVSYLLFFLLRCLIFPYELCI